MRDIRDDLRDRASRLETRISSENAEFERAIHQLKTKLDSTLAPLQAQLRLAHKLLEFAAWHDRVRADVRPHRRGRSGRDVHKEIDRDRPLILWRLPNRPPSQ